MLYKNIDHLFDDIKLEKGIVSFVGAGGKTSTMLLLAKQASKSNKVIITTSTKIYMPSEIPFIECIKEDSEYKIYKALENSNLVACGKILNNIPEKVMSPNIPFNKLSKYCDYMFIEADGAKGCPVKVPDVHEPVIDTLSKTIISVIGIDCLHKRILDVAFRPEKLAIFLNKEINDFITEDDFCSIITDINGLRKNVRNNMRYIVFINKVDNEESFYDAAEIRMRLTHLGHFETCIISHHTGGFCYDCID